MMSGYRIIIAGDTFPRRKNYSAFESCDVSFLLDDKIRSLFQGSDYRICNLEGCFVEDTSTPNCKSGPILRAPVNTFPGFLTLGFDSVCLANNHITDYKKEGFDTTVELLERSNTGYFGAGYGTDFSNSVVVQAGKKKVVIYAVAQMLFNSSNGDMPGANVYDEYKICDELRQIKKTCDYLVVLFHGGPENFWYGSPKLRQRFHRMADSGADVVIGQHSHCIGLQENYNGAYLLYGQGNFMFAQDVDNEYVKQALLLCLNVTDGGIEVERHLVCNDKGKICYAKQDFSDYDARNKRFAEGDNFDEEYMSYCNSLMYNFLIAFRGRNIKDRIMKMILPKGRYLDYLRKQYDKSQVLRMINAMQSDQYNELITQGLWNMVNMK